MGSAVTETATWESQVIGPDGSSLRTAASVREGLQDLANRTKWLKEAFVDFKHDFDGSDNKVLATTAAKPNNGSLQLTNVKAGDRVLVTVSFTVEQTSGSAYTPDSATYQAVTAYLEVGGAPAWTTFDNVITWPSNVPANVPARGAASLQLVHEVAADSSLLNIDLFLVTLRASPTVTVKAISMTATHFRKGQA